MLVKKLAQLDSLETLDIFKEQLATFLQLIRGLWLKYPFLLINILHLIIFFSSNKEKLISKQE